MCSYQVLFPKAVILHICLFLVSGAAIALWTQFSDEYKKNCWFSDCSTLLLWGQEWLLPNSSLVRQRWFHHWILLSLHKLLYSYVRIYSNGINIIEDHERQSLQHNAQLYYNPYINTKVSKNPESCYIHLSYEHRGKCQIFKSDMAGFL